MTRRGTLIVIEGVDRSDRESLTGKIINDYLNGKSSNDQAIHLLFSANRWEQMDEMKQLLMEGYVLLVDRYCYSGIAYSSAKGLDFDWCCNSDKGLLKPDLVLFFDLDPQLAIERGDYGNERYESLNFQQKVYRAKAGQ
ncbi:hypothetical protein HDV06_003033 [Boothiomyces sp. JEL0866]|nr:hypothetical protein HDV06_003033 [Boothiomyces sp. JEL0866]